MANGYFPDWDEWRDLTTEQKEYELYKILNFVHAETQDIKETCQKRINICSQEFDCIKKEIDSKRFIERVITGGTGLIGGALAYLGFKIGG